MADESKPSDQEPKRRRRAGWGDAPPSEDAVASAAPAVPLPSNSGNATPLQQQLLQQAQMAARAQHQMPGMFAPAQQNPQMAAQMAQMQQMQQMMQNPVFAQTMMQNPAAMQQLMMQQAQLMAQQQQQQMAMAQPPQQQQQQQGAAPAVTPGTVGAGGSGGASGAAAAGASAGGGEPFRQGDWHCPSCSAHNYASKAACFKCGVTRPPEAGPVMPFHHPGSSAAPAAAPAAAASGGASPATGAAVPVAGVSLATDSTASAGAAAITTAVPTSTNAATALAAAMAMAKQTNLVGGATPAAAAAPSTGAGAGGVSSGAAAAAALLMQASSGGAAAAAASAASMSEAAARSKACRIYVGSLHYDLREPEIRSVFQAFGPIKDFTMPFEGGNKSKGFCFIEYENPESAHQALTQMGGFQFAGRAIKVGRPDGTAAATAPVPQASTAAAAAFPPHQQQQAFTPNHVATSAALDAALGRGPPVGVAMHMGGGGASGMLQGGKPKVHISNLDANINAEVVRSLFEPFGQVTECTLPPDPHTGTGHRGYGFIVFADPKAGADAVAQMNNFDLLGRPLKVQWANSPQMPPTGIAAPAPPAPPVVLGAPGGGAASGPAAAAAAVTLTAGVATAPGDGNGSGNGGGGYRCTVLENMVTAVEAADPELEGEIKEECSKYGDIETVKVVIQSAAAVRVFVLFATPQAAEAARQGLNNRYFAGRVVIGALYNHDLFLAGNYTA